jgi:hypothetical protein
LKVHVHVFSYLLLLISSDLNLPCRLIDYLLFYVPLKNFSLTWRRKHIAGEELQNFGLYLAFRAFEQGGSLSCHTCCDTGPQFFRSHRKDRPIQSPLTTHKGMWRIYSNPDPHGSLPCRNR